MPPANEKLKMSIYALLEWEDKYVSIIDVLNIIHPRKDVDRYFEGEIITAKYKGKPYNAVIAELNDDKKILDEQKRKGILKFRYTSCKENENEEPQDTLGKSNTTSDNNSEGSSNSNNHDSDHQENINDTSLDSLSELDDDSSVNDQSVMEISENTADEDQPSSAPESRSNIFSSLTSKILNVNQSESKPVEKRRSLEDDIHDLQYDIKKLKKRVKLLENAEGEHSPRTPSINSIKYNGLSIDDLKDLIKHSEFTQSLDIVLKKIFSSEEILTKSISGKKSIKSSASGPRPAMDQDKMNVLFDVLRWKFPNFARKDVVEKIQNIQKVMRRVEKKKSE